MSGTRVYVGGLHRNVQIQDLEQLFKGYGKIRKILIKLHYGIVVFDDHKDADDAIDELNGKTFLGQRVTVERARAKAPRDDRDDGIGSRNSCSNEDRGAGRGGGRNSRSSENRCGGVGCRWDIYGPPIRSKYRIFVENLNSGAEWQELKDYMRPAGKVIHVDAHKHRPNEGVVEFDSYTDMKAAMDKFDDTEFYGQRVRLVEDKGPGGEPKRSRSFSRSRSRRRDFRSRSKSKSKSKYKSQSRAISRSKLRSKGGGRNSRSSEDRGDGGHGVTRDDRDDGRGGGRNSRSSEDFIGGDLGTHRGWAIYGPPTRSKFRIFVENVSSQAPWQALKDYMRPTVNAKVTYANAHRRQRNEGVVEYGNYSDMKAAMDKFNDTVFYGQRIRLVEDKGRRGKILLLPRGDHFEGIPALNHSFQIKRDIQHAIICLKTDPETTTSLILYVDPSISTPMMTDAASDEQEEIDFELRPVILEEGALHQLPVDDGPDDNTFESPDLLISAEEETNHPHLPGTDVDDEDPSMPNPMVTDAPPDEDVDLDLNPVILEEGVMVDVVQDKNPLQSQSDEDADEGLCEDTISEEEEINDPDQGGTMKEDEPSPKNSRRCKARATQLIYDILRNDDEIDDDENDEYSPTIESDTDSNERDDGGGMSSNPSTSVRNGGDQLTCEVCGKQVVHLSRHMEIHRSDGQTFSCETCHKPFSTARYLSAHRKSVHLKQLRHKCQKCGKGFFHAQNLKRHLEMRIPCTELVKNKKFVCPICKDGFSTKTHLATHTRSAHNGEKRSYCPHPKCRYRNFDKTKLEHHLEIHHPQDEISCTICNQKFSSVKEKLDHLKSSHEFCNQSFPNKVDLDEHQTTDRTGDQPYVCTKCGNKFSWKKELGLHFQNTPCNPDKEGGEGLKDEVQ